LRECLFFDTLAGSEQPRDHSIEGEDAERQTVSDQSGTLKAAYGTGGGVYLIGGFNPSCNFVYKRANQVSEFMAGVLSQLNMK